LNKDFDLKKNWVYKFRR